MKSKIISILIIIIFIASLTPIVESVTKTKDNIYNSNVEIDINTVNSYAEKPIWNVGDKWEYFFSFNVKVNEEGTDAEIDLLIYNIELVVEEKTEDTYNLTLNGDINGDFSFKTTGFPRIRGGLQNTAMHGFLIFDKDFSIKNASLYIDGTLKVSIVPVTIDIELNVTFNPPITLIDFPLYVGKEWLTNPSVVHIFGVINLPGLKNIPGIPEDVPDNFPIDETIFNEMSNVSCTDLENITVAGLGKYETYKIESVNKTNYYSPVLGNFVEIVSPPNDYTRVSFYLQSTNYTVPGAPNIPSKPEGINKGKPGTAFVYSTSTIDNENDSIYYLFDWDDGSNSGWLGPYPSGETINTSKTWSNKGSYSVRVKAKDTEGHESRWSEVLYVSMPKVKRYHLLQSLFDFLYEHFPIIKQILSNVQSFLEKLFLQ
jgi:hypothetical protein